MSRRLHQKSPLGFRERAHTWSGWNTPSPEIFLNRWAASSLTSSVPIWTSTWTCLFVRTRMAVPTTGCKESSAIFGKALPPWPVWNCLSLSRPHLAAVTSCFSMGCECKLTSLKIRWNPLRCSSLVSGWLWTWVIPLTWIMSKTFALAWHFHHDLWPALRFKSLPNVGGLCAAKLFASLWSTDCTALLLDDAVSDSAARSSPFVSCKLLPAKRQYFCNLPVWQPHGVAWFTVSIFYRLLGWLETIPLFRIFQEVDADYAQPPVCRPHDPTANNLIYCYNPLHSDFWINQEWVCVTWHMPAPSQLEIKLVQSRVLICFNAFKSRITEVMRSHDPRMIWAPGSGRPALAPKELPVLFFHTFPLALQSLNWCGRIAFYRNTRQRWEHSSLGWKINLTDVERWS